MQLTCPTKRQLRDLLEGSVSETEAAQILAHTDECPSCEQILSELEGALDDVPSLLQEAQQTEDLLKEPEFEELRNTARFGRSSDTAPLEGVESGKRLRDYRLVRKIGEGGMGTVYQAIHVHLAKPVALKILPVDKLRSTQSVRRFRQEMRAVGRVNHPNVVSASDAGKIDGQHFLVMELVLGADLARIIRDQGSLRVVDACEIVRQAAAGLQHAHDSGLVHRDVKPSNVMLTVDGIVKVLDLGLASLNKSGFETSAGVVVQDGLTSVGQIMGTLGFMAPEQITASPDVDGRADVYGLGATLFQLLTSRTPCGDRSQEIPDRIDATLNQPPLDIATLRNDVPEGLRSLLFRMLAKNPEDRPQTAGEVASQMARFSSQANLVALAETCRTSLDMPSADVDVTDDASFLVSRTLEPEKQATQPKSLTARGFAGALVALMAAAVYFFVTNSGIFTVNTSEELMPKTSKQESPTRFQIEKRVRKLLANKETRAEGNRLLQQLWDDHPDSLHDLLSFRPQEIWPHVDDLSPFLRSRLIPENIAAAGSGWASFEAEGIHGLAEEPLWGYPLGLRPLEQDHNALQTLIKEVEIGLDQHSDWKAGRAVLSYLQAALGNYSDASKTLQIVLDDAKSRPIPSDAAFLFGMALEGRDASLDRQVMRLYELSLQNRPPRAMHTSAIPKLGRLYARYAQPSEARQVLHKMATPDYDPSGSTVICSPGRRPQNRSRCTECHSGKSNLLDVVTMSNHLTAIGYPVDSLLALARIDASFRNAYGSSDAWTRTNMPADFYSDIERGRTKFLPAKAKAMDALTPGAVMAALEDGVFSGRDLTEPTTLNSKSPVDLMVSVRGTDSGTVLFSPVVDLLAHLVYSADAETADQLDRIDRQLQRRSRYNPDDIETAAAATIFAFVQKDLRDAETRLVALMQIAKNNDVEAAKAATSLWLVAQTALQHGSTRVLGQELAAKALEVATLLPTPEFKEANLREQSASNHQADSADSEHASRVDDLAQRIARLQESIPTIAEEYPKETTHVVYSVRAYRTVIVAGERVFVEDESSQGIETRELKGIRGSEVTGLSISRNGDRVCLSTKKGARLWDPVSGKQVAILHEGSPVHLAQFSANGGKFLVTSAGKNEAMLWDSRTGEPINRLAKHDDVLTSIRFNKAESVLVTGARDGSIGILDIQSAQSHYVDHGGAITNLCFSEDERSILSSSASDDSDKNSVQIWDVATGKQTLMRKHNAGVTASFIEKGKQFVSVSGGEIAWWNVNDGKKVKQLSCSGAVWNQARFSHDRINLLILHGRDAIQWNLVHREPICTLSRAGEAICDQFSNNLTGVYPLFFALTKNGAWRYWHLKDSLKDQEENQLIGSWVTTKIISGGKEQEVEAKLEFTAEKCTITMEGRRPDKCSYSIENEKSPKHMDLVFMRIGRAVTLPAIFELEDGELKICHPLKENGDRPESMKSNPSNVLFYCIRDTRENPKETTQVNGSAPGIVWKKQPLYGAHQLTFPSSRWFSDGSKLLKYIGRGTKFHIVRLSDGLPLTPPIQTAGHGVLGTINNNVAYSADYEGLRLWNASSGKPIGDLIPHKIDESSIIPPLLLASGRMVVRNRLNEIQFWDTKTLKPISKPLHQGNDVDGLQCSEDESLVFVSTRAKTISVYNAKETTRVAGPISGDFRFLHLPKQEKLLTVELRNITRIRGSDRRIETLVIRSTGGNWNEVQTNCDLSVGRKLTDRSCVEVCRFAFWLASDAGILPPCGINRCRKR